MTDISDIFSIIGTITSFILSFSPIFPFIKVLKKQDKIDILPEGLLFSLILTRLAWGAVWIITKRKIAIFNSISGIIICNIFIILYFYIYFNRTYKKTIISGIALILIEGFTLYMAVLWANQTFLAVIAMIFNILVFISPGQKILRVIKEKNYKLIPIYSTIINIIYSIAWLAYGISIQMISSIIPNVLGLFFSLINTGAWIYYYNRRKKTKFFKSAKQNEVELVEK